MIKNKRKRSGGTKRTSLSKDLQTRILQRVIDIVNSDLDVSLIFHSIMSMMLEYTKADSCFLYILDRKTEELVLVASSNPHPEVLRNIRLKVGEGITGWVAEKKEAVIIPEKAFEDPRFKVFNSLPEDKYEAFVGIPILLNGKVVGVINFQHKNKKRYSKSTLQGLTSIAQLVSGLIRNTWLYEEMKEKTLHLETIFRISKMIISSHSLQEVLDLIVEVVAEVMSSPICSIMLINKKKGVLEIKATQSLDPMYLNRPPLKIGEGISGKAVSEKRPIFVLDVQNEPEFKMRDVAEKQGLRSLLSVPMLIRGEAIGVINVYTLVPRRFSQDEVSWLQVIADQAAIVIENAKLEEDSRSAKEALEARKLIERAKGILMKELGLSEEVAYRLIHKKSMDMCKPMKEIAQAIILSREVANG